MTASPQMPSVRRRPIPGMTSSRSAPPPPPSVESDRLAAAPSPAASSREPDQPETTVAPQGAQQERWPAQRRFERSVSQADTSEPADRREDAARRRPAADYASTRLVNFRIPVDLHDRYRQLIRDAEQQHPRLRRPSLTELVIALLEEGPETPGHTGKATPGEGRQDRREDGDRKKSNS
jgi:hypothetical protein